MLQFQVSSNFPEFLNFLQKFSTGIKKKRSQNNFNACNNR